MAVEMIIDHWNPSTKRYRRETFCYRPKSCALYKAGPIRPRTKTRIRSFPFVNRQFGDACEVTQVAGEDLIAAQQRR